MILSLLIFILGILIPGIRDIFVGLSHHFHYQFFKLVCSFEERRETERVIVKGLLALEGDLKGDYFPLHGSRSYAPKPNGMTEEKEEQLRKAGNLFQEPDSTLLLSSGCGRHWPDARGE